MFKNIGNGKSEEKFVGFMFDVYLSYTFKNEAFPFFPFFALFCSCNDVIEYTRIYLIL